MLIGREEILHSPNRRLLCFSNFLLDIFFERCIINPQCSLKTAISGSGPLFYMGEAKVGRKLEKPGFRIKRSRAFIFWGNTRQGRGAMDSFKRNLPRVL